MDGVDRSDGCETVFTEPRSWYSPSSLDTEDGGGQMAEGSGSLPAAPTRDSPLLLVWRWRCLSVSSCHKIAALKYHKTSGTETMNIHLSHRYGSVGLDYAVWI